MYIFKKVENTWLQQAKLTASDKREGDRFGHAVDIENGIVLVGAHGNSSGTGAAYIFAKKNGKWVQQEKLTANDKERGDQFGFSVATDGSTVVAGAYNDNNQSGAAYIFTRSG